jgi:RimJ/RimL family protein N-acetyltransferase
VAPEPFLPFRTERLVVRNMRAGDVPAFTAYRNDPDVARYQDWQLPYTEQMARRLVESQEEIDGPVSGDWVQLALDDGSGRLIGDLAVFVDAGTRLAMIGYTLDAAEQGKGLATEAVGALVDRLFDRTGVHRIAATLDPANVASARLLERLGFRYEGCARQAALVRGEWADDDRYALLADERRAWRERSRHRPGSVRLVEVTRELLGAVERLATHRTQQEFVATMAESFADALVPEITDGHPVQPWFRAIEADGEVVGFVMLAARTEFHPVAFLWRLLIDARHQGRGIGRIALRLLGEHLAARGESQLKVSWVDAPGGPGGFYARLGFEPTGEIDDGEVVAVVAVERLLQSAP